MIFPFGIGRRIVCLKIHIDADLELACIAHIHAEMIDGVVAALPIQINEVFLRRTLPRSRRADLSPILKRHEIGFRHVFVCIGIRIQHGEIELNGTAVIYGVNFDLHPISIVQGTNDRRLKFVEKTKIAVVHAIIGTVKEEIITIAIDWRRDLNGDGMFFAKRIIPRRNCHFPLRNGRQNTIGADFCNPFIGRCIGNIKGLIIEKISRRDDGERHCFIERKGVCGTIDTEIVRRRRLADTDIVKHDFVGASSHKTEADHALPCRKCKRVGVEGIRICRPVDVSFSVAIQRSAARLINLFIRRIQVRGTPCVQRPRQRIPHCNRLCLSAIHVDLVIKCPVGDREQFHAILENIAHAWLEIGEGKNHVLPVAVRHSVRIHQISIVPLLTKFGRERILGIAHLDHAGNIISDLLCRREVLVILPHFNHFDRNRLGYCAVLC